MNRTMGGKPVIEIPSKSIINFESGFGHKLLCDGLTFSTGTSCVYSCSFCYVADLMRRNLQMHKITERHDKIVIRRSEALQVMASQLIDRFGRPRFKSDDRRVIYASPLVDVAANMELVAETIAACTIILEQTNWQIRLLSKSNLLPLIAKGVCGSFGRQAVLDRMIFGVSTGTLDDGLARVFEEGCPLVSKRLQSLYWLQDNGFRTYGMICPSLPQDGYEDFAEKARDAIRADQCEHVWAEVLNVRGESMTRTVACLRAGGFDAQADALEKTRKQGEWELYARSTFLAHAKFYEPGKLRFLQYVTANSRPWWKDRENIGAILL